MSCIDYYYFLQKVLQLHKGLLKIYIGDRPTVYEIHFKKGLID